MKKFYNLGWGQTSRYEFVNEKYIFLFLILNICIGYSKGDIEF